MKCLRIFAEKITKNNRSNNLQIFLTNKQSRLIQYIYGAFYREHHQPFITKNFIAENMFGSLKQFIEVQLPLIESKLSTEQNQQENQSFVDEMLKKRAISNTQQYQPSDKSNLLLRFNIKNHAHKNNNSVLVNNRNYKTQSQRKTYEHVSVFVKNEITKDYIAKSELKRKHNLLRAIVRTNQNQNQNQGVSDYDQSFKRLYQKFQSIYSKPILEYRNFVIDQSDNQLPAHTSIQLGSKPINSLNNRKRIEFQNCLSWAKKHKKKTQFYEKQLGKHHKQKKQQKINIGHSMMPELQRKLRTFSHSHKTD